MMPKERLIIPTFSGGFAGRSAFGNPGDGANIQPIETRKANNYIFDRVRSIVPYPRLVEDLTVFDDMATDLIANQSLLYMPSDYNLVGEQTENSRFLVANSASGKSIVNNSRFITTKDWTLGANITHDSVLESIEDDRLGGDYNAYTDLDVEMEINQKYIIRIVANVVDIANFWLFAFYVGDAASTPAVPGSWTLATPDGGVFPGGPVGSGAEKKMYTITYTPTATGWVKIRLGLFNSRLFDFYIYKQSGLVRFYDMDSAGADTQDFDVAPGAGFMFNIDGALRINKFTNNLILEAAFFSEKIMWQDFVYFRDLGAPFPVNGIRQYNAELSSPDELTITKGADPVKSTHSFPENTVGVNNNYITNTRTPSDEDLSEYDNTIAKGHNTDGNATAVEFFTQPQTSLTVGIKRVRVKFSFNGGAPSSNETGVNFNIFCRIGETTDTAVGTAYLASGYQRDSKLSVYIPTATVRSYEFDFPLDSLLVLGVGNHLGVSFLVEACWWGGGNANNGWGAYITSIEVEMLDNTTTITTVADGLAIKVGSMAGYDETIWADKEYKFAGCYYYESGQASPLAPFNIDTPFTAGGPLYALIALKNIWNIPPLGRIRGFGLYMREKEKDDYNKFVDCDFQTGEATIWPMNIKVPMTYDSSDENYKLEYYPDEDAAVPFETFYTTYGINPELTSFNCAYHLGVFTNRKVYAANVKISTLTKDFVIDMDGVYYSLVNKPDMFSIENRLDIVKNDGDRVVALVEYADRLLVFKTTKTFIINISKEYEFLEEELTDNGIAGVANVARTKEGVFWINENGMFRYDGRRTNELLLREDGSRKIPVGEWKSLMINPTDGAIWQGLYYMPSKRILMWHGSAVSAGPVDAFGATAPEMVFYHIDFDSITYASGFFTDPPGGGFIALPDSYMSKIVYVSDDQKHYFIVEAPINDPCLWHIDENIGTDLATAAFDLDTKIFRLAEQGQKRFNLYSVSIWLDLSTSATADITITTDKGTIGPFTYVAPNNDLNEAVYNVSAEANARGITEVSFKVNNMSNFTGVDGFPKSRYVEKAYIIYRKIGRGAETKQ